jgi:hypothetical protein
MVTCTSVHDHHGIMIGYLDPTWARSEESARKFAAFCAFGNTEASRIEQRVQHMLRVRRISLAVPLAQAFIWNDHGRMHMNEQARRELEAESNA